MRREKERRGRCSLIYMMRTKTKTEFICISDTQPAYHIQIHQHIPGDTIESLTGCVGNSLASWHDALLRVAEPFLDQFLATRARLMLEVVTTVWNSSQRKRFIGSFISYIYIIQYIILYPMLFQLAGERLFRYDSGNWSDKPHNRRRLTGEI